MEVLKKLVAEKRESLGGRRWVKRSELIEKREAALEAKRRKVEPPSSSSSSSGPSPPSAEEDHHEKEELAALVSAPSEEVVRRLRAIGEPARLFGESDVARCERLAAAERAGRVEDEFKLEGAYAIRNTFLAEGDENEDESESEDETPPSNLKLIRSWIRARLGDWRRDLNARSDSEKRAPRGRVETKTFQQCRDYIRPLVNLCRRKELDPAMAAALANIVSLCDRGDFVEAHDAYILVAIGNAAWPIGVTSVGIHTRTAREAVEQKNVAHVMNNEMQRKYLTSIKRLVKIAQDRRPDVPPSKKVLG